MGDPTYSQSDLPEPSEPSGPAGPAGPADPSGPPEPVTPAGRDGLAAVLARPERAVVALDFD
ncbi:hypothetical protein G3I45_31655, partial [Streptomyces sp. SID339]|nr:hypothetical protein [Streptomyces sp. SID339]